AAEVGIVHNATFNVGSDSQNYQVREVAQAVADVFPGCELTFGASGGDNRSYRVSFEKITKQLPGFSCDWDARRGAQQLHDVFAAVELDATTFTGRGHTRLKQLEYLLRTRQLDPQLFWSV
ncbi:MAG TPA: NAD-dependent dehydratase, partial [Dermatophilaceae bacterium]